MTITEFLLARIAEEENAVREAIAYRDATQFRPGHEPELPDMSLWANDDVLGGATVSIGPERLLAECQTKRDLIEWALGLEYLRDVNDPAAPAQPLGDEVLRMLAAVYTDHPDFDPSWRID